ncbi:MAG TPA: hypothetical protein PKG52_09900 [bacterium]|nr:hypothetical protein [bacterium]HPS31034.1 hypothetical protein [bacterium]
MPAKSHASTSKLIELCIGYFIFYVITGVAVKFFLSTKAGFPGLDGMEYLVYNTAGGTIIATGVVLILKWYHLDSIKKIKFMGLMIPSEIPYILASGVCTAVVIPTTTLLYSFKGISVMVAMVIMRGAVIIIGRVVDEIQIRQGILKKKVFAEENFAMMLALVAVSINIIGDDGSSGGSVFTSLPAMIIFGSYIMAYSFRIYIMNYYKNTRHDDCKKDTNKAFFAIEQIASTSALIMVTIAIVVLAKSLDITGERITPFVNAVTAPNPTWSHWAFLAGLAYGVVAFFSVFLFMFKGRTATFAGLVNRLTSLIAGTTSTLLFAYFFSGNYPEIIDWISLLFILGAVGFMAKAEKKRKKELEIC